MAFAPEIFSVFAGQKGAEGGDVIPEGAQAGWTQTEIQNRTVTGADAQEGPAFR